MKAALAGVDISPVNMTERKELGLRPGDTVRVHQKIVDEKGKTRIQVFAGLVLARKHGAEPGATFTVRKVSSGVGVEKIFPLYSPMIDKIEIVRRAKVRRAKLYHIREKVNREIKRQMRRMSFVSMATESEAEASQRAAEEAKRAEEEAAQQAEAEAAASEATTDDTPEVALEAEAPATEAAATEAESSDDPADTANPDAETSAEADVAPAESAAESAETTKPADAPATEEPTEEDTANADATPTEADDETKQS